MAAVTLSKPALDVRSRGLLTVGLMLATIMQVLDSTIANVALPHMTASLNAAQSEITWVLTSYIVASAIATPLTGWLSDRFGRKELFLAAVAGFTVMSVLCGMATTLGEMVTFRILQGLFGAVIAPLAQSLLLDINPREKIGQAMAIYGAGIMVGPIIGPTLGGYLTEMFNWRWVFLVNLPVGILAFMMISSFAPHESKHTRPFDMFGFGMLALSVGALQLLLDRGSEIGWFDSVEAWFELGLSISCFWIFIVHSLTTEHPFVDLRMFKDRNFSMGLLFIFVIGLAMFSGLTLLPPLLQSMMGYPVIESGLLMAPRGIATMVAMVFVGRLIGRIDARIMVVFGLGITAYSQWMMAGFNLEMGPMPVVWSGVVQGIGLGFVFVPLSTLTFATLKSKYRTDATSFFNLVRNIGSGVGVSIVTIVLTNMVQVNHAELAEQLTSTSRAVTAYGSYMLSGSKQVLAILNQLVTQQAYIISYLDDFYMMVFITLLAMPIVALMRGAHHGDDDGLGGMMD